MLVFHCNRNLFQKKGQCKQFISTFLSAPPLLFNAMTCQTLCTENVHLSVHFFFLYINIILVFGNLNNLAAVLPIILYFYLLKCMLLLCCCLCLHHLFYYIFSLPLKWISFLNVQNYYFKITCIQFNKQYRNWSFLSFKWQLQKLLYFYITLVTQYTYPSRPTEPRSQH